MRDPENQCHAYSCIDGKVVVIDEADKCDCNPVSVLKGFDSRTFMLTADALGVERGFSHIKVTGLVNFAYDRPIAARASNKVLLFWLIHITDVTPSAALSFWKSTSISTCIVI